jgi:DNA-binding response OmpR family regulator
MVIIKSDSSERLLLVEDEPAISELLEIRLTMLGFKVHTASGEGEALQAARAYSPRLILSDTYLGGDFGPKIVPVLRAEGYRGLVYGMSTDEEVENRWIQAGAQRFFPKRSLTGDPTMAVRLMRGDLEASGGKYR